MSGYDEAVDWLRENALEWRLLRSETRLTPGATIGAPTGQTVTVELCDQDAYFRQKFGVGYVTLSGEGATILEACQRAVGGVAREGEPG